MQHNKNPCINILFSIVVLFFLLSCGKEETILRLTIIEQPQSGTNVSFIQCTFEGEVVSGDESVRVEAEWWEEDQYGFNETQVGAEYFDFDSQQPISRITSYGAPFPFVLYGYYWVEFVWSDDEGQHRRESQKAFCEVY